MHMQHDQSHRSSHGYNIVLFDRSRLEEMTRPQVAVKPMEVGVGVGE
jgi:hypothetical protein